MPVIQMPITSHWRRLTESWKEATRLKLTPEYSDDHCRSRNHRYYR